jgi:hypothetical protein
VANIAEVAVHTNTGLNQFARPAIANFSYLPSNNATLSFSGILGEPVIVWASSNLGAAWQPVFTNMMGTTGQWQLADPASSGIQQQFCRASSW